MKWTDEKLNELLTKPSPELIEYMRTLDDDIAILGAGGKVGTSLAILARKALNEAKSDLDVYAISRYSDPEKKEEVEKYGIKTIAADLSLTEDLDALPDFRNILFLAGRKFGTSGAESLTWEANASVPTLVARRFRGARIVVFSTGNIYPLVEARSGGCTEESPVSPIGEYAMSSLARERIFEHAASTFGTRVTLFRLNFAIDLRYGVLADVAKQILNDEPVNLTVPNFNCIWQGYVSEVAIRSLGDASTDVFTLNVTGPEINSTRLVAEKMAKHLGKDVSFGPEGELSFLNNASKCMDLYGFPEYGIDRLIEWQASWIMDGGEGIDAPTHFEVNKGNF